ncbi:MAG: prepilin-type N-terminal cleavage/methylation domain-containing protein [Candidatus Marinimicrobia bacterium]|nr:prepilin-type N-terminal cleavage/methylation domain-containing protein [Candidatus Neomarinimicrobiota bacterium]
MDTMRRRHHTGFSILELLIALVIICVLVVNAVPFYSTKVAEARLAEADSALSSIREELRIYKYEYGEFPKEVNSITIIGAGWNQLKAGDLAGKYFSDNSYTYRSPNPKSFVLRCNKGEALKRDRTLTELGVFGFE